MVCFSLAKREEDQYSGRVVDDGLIHMSIKKKSFSDTLWVYMLDFVCGLLLFVEDMVLEILLESATTNDFQKQIQQTQKKYKNLLKFNPISLYIKPSR